MELFDPLEQTSIKKPFRHLKTNSARDWYQLVDIICCRIWSLNIVESALVTDLHFELVQMINE
jgi:hypothetical protein